MGLTDCHVGLRPPRNDGGGICLRDCAPFLFACAKRSGKRKTHKATQHRDLFAPKGMFFSYTAPSKHGRRQPCRASLSCLSEKHLPWECIAVLNKIFFLSAMPTDAEILCVLQIRWRKLWGKIFIQNRLNPYAVSPFGIPPSGADNSLGGASGRIYCLVPTKLVTLKLPQRCAGVGAAMVRWMLGIYPLS